VVDAAIVKEPAEAAAEGVPTVVREVEVPRDEDASIGLQENGIDGRVAIEFGVEGRVDRPVAFEPHQARIVDVGSGGAESAADEEFSIGLLCHREDANRESVHIARVKGRCREGAIARSIRVEAGEHRELRHGILAADEDFAVGLRDDGVDDVDALIGGDSGKREEIEIGSAVRVEALHTGNAAEENPAVGLHGQREDGMAHKVILKSGIGRPGGEQALNGSPGDEDAAVGLHGQRGDFGSAGIESWIEGAVEVQAKEVGARHAVEGKEIATDQESPIVLSDEGGDGPRNVAGEIRCRWSREGRGNHRPEGVRER
jgi:hypothetical protein